MEMPKPKMTIATLWKYGQ